MKWKCLVDTAFEGYSNLELFLLFFRKQIEIILSDIISSQTGISQPPEYFTTT